MSINISGAYLYDLPNTVCNGPGSRLGRSNPNKDSATRQESFWIMGPFVSTGNSLCLLCNKDNKGVPQGCALGHLLFVVPIVTE